MPLLLTTRSPLAQSHVQLPYLPAVAWSVQPTLARLVQALLRTGHVLPVVPTTSFLVPVSLVKNPAVVRARAVLRVHTVSKALPARRAQLALTPLLVLSHAQVAVQVSTLTMALRHARAALRVLPLPLGLLSVQPVKRVLTLLLVNRAVPAEASCCLWSD
jgi:hypothetical protein